MKIILKLFASLDHYLPKGTQGNVIELEVGTSATPNQIIDQHKIPRQQAHLVTRNGIYVPPEARDELVLEPDDELAIWPPVAGG